MPKCKACGAPILWIAMQSGKSMPVDAEQLLYRADKSGESTIITPNGETLRATLNTQPETATGIGYKPHWATCPHANKFKRKETPTPEKFERRYLGKWVKGDDHETD